MFAKKGFPTGLLLFSLLILSSAASDGTSVEPEHMKLVQKERSTTGELNHLDEEIDVKTLDGLEGLVSIRKVSETDPEDFSFPQVVCILGETPEGKVEGTGFVIASGYVLSSGHGVKQSGQLAVQFQDGSTEAATLLSVGKEVDLSLLKISSKEIGPLPFSGAQNERVGETVVAVGCPFGLNHSIARGIISAPERVLDDRPLLQTDVPINPGNSGGPLLNKKGEVVGVVIGLLPEARGIAFAVPGREARRFLGESFFQMGALFAEKNRYPEAAEALRRSVGFSPRSARTYSNLGEVYRRMKEIRKAEAAFTKAVEIDPQYADAHYNLGVLYDGELHDPGKAAFHYRRYLELEPNSPEAVRIGRWLAALEAKGK